MLARFSDFVRAISANAEDIGCFEEAIEHSQVSTVVDSSVSRLSVFLSLI
jgi:hypothetical protein